jgi:hypothetical protein
MTPFQGLLIYQCIRFPNYRVINYDFIQTVSFFLCRILASLRIRRCIAEIDLGMRPWNFCRIRGESYFVSGPYFLCNVIGVPNMLAACGTAAEYQAADRLILIEIRSLLKTLFQP